MHPVWWRVLLLAGCVLVFGFALHAKLAVYGHTPQPQASTSSKLWLGAGKLEPQQVEPVVSVFWLALFLLSSRLQPAEGRYHGVRLVPAVQQYRQYSPHRFLRPPPQY